MNCAILIRERQLQGTALQNAARYDANFLRGLGHTVGVYTVSEGDRMPREIDSVNADALDFILVEGGGWIFPETVEALVKHCRVAIRIHAAPEFLYSEFPGTCMTEYIGKVTGAGAGVVFVSQELAAHFGAACLPINYPVPEYVPAIAPPDGIVHVGMFGSIRPLKNHVGQFLAVAKYRDYWQPKRTFVVHINSTRIEGNNDILGELKSLSGALHIPLVSHAWTPTDEFREKVIPTMSVGMFGSYAESFCITAADFVSAGIPCVLSRHIPWAFSPCETSVDEMAKGLEEALSGRYSAAVQLFSLTTWVRRCAGLWANALKGLEGI